jgi:hypothetical protein
MAIKDVYASPVGKQAQSVADLYKTSPQVTWGDIGESAIQRARYLTDPRMEPSSAGQIARARHERDIQSQMGALDAFKIAAEAGESRSKQLMDAIKGYSPEDQARIVSTMEAAPVDYNESNMVTGAIKTANDLGLVRQRSTAKPSAIQEYEYYKNLPEEEKQNYMAVKRQQQVIDTGGSKIMIDPATGQVRREIQKTLAPQQELEYLSKAEQSKAEGKMLSEAKSELGGVEQQANDALALIDKIVNHPGLEESFGGFLGLKGRQAGAVPLTENQRNFAPLYEQLQGQNFLQAYERLKGGGQITEIEGRKGEAAIARMSRVQEPGAFIEALNDLKEVIEAGVKRARSKAGKPQTVGDLMDGNTQKGVTEMSDDELKKALGL